MPAHEDCIYEIGWEHCVLCVPRAIQERRGLEARVAAGTASPEDCRRLAMLELDDLAFWA